MPTQAKAKTTAKVTVNCEQCGKSYTYEHYFYAYGRLIDEQAAISLAKANMDKVYEHYSSQINAGNFSSIVENKPCPNCGSIQSWMVELIRKKHAWKMGLIWAAVVFLLAIPSSFILNALVNNPAMDVVFFVMIFIVPICTLLTVRSRALKNYKSAKGTAPSGKINHPVVELHKGLLPETHLVL